MALVVYGLMGVGSLAVMAWRGELGLVGPDPGSALARVGLADGAGNVGLGLLIGLLVVSLTHSVLTRFQWADFLQHAMREVLAGLTARQAVGLALLSGIGEELLFRGVLLPAVAAVAGPVAGLAVSSVIFGVVHVGPDRRFLGWTAFATVMGFLLGGLFLVSGGLLVPAVVHVAVNGLNLLHETWERRLFPDGAPSP